MSEPPTGPEKSVQTLQLLRTKLFIPRAHPDIVARPRLIQKLNRSLSCRLALVSAPAGFGKTTLLAEWVDGLRLKVGRSGAEESLLQPANLHPAIAIAWLSLDERDNDPVRFWSYLVAAVQTLHPGAGGSALAMLQSPQPPPLESILTGLLNEITLLPQEFVIVLDDIHAIQTQAIHDGLAFLVQNLPAQMHLVLAGRSVPPLPLAQLRVKRDLVELHAGDLRFTHDEASAFLNQVLKLNLPAASIEALDRLTEGWAAGLQIAALSMQDAGDIAGFLRSFSGSHRHVFDYLAQEVLDRQPDETRDFLLKTSILERLSADLCDAILKDEGSAASFASGRMKDEGSDFILPPSSFILQYIERANLFLVPLDQHRQWYRYHHLFSDFLKGRLLQDYGRETVSGLHRLASRWHQEHGYITEAVDHALSAGDFEQAGELVRGSAVEMFRRSELFTLVHWLESLPRSLVSADAYLSMAFAWALLATGRSDATEPHLQAVERSLGAEADGSEASLSLPAEVQGALGEISCLRATIAFNRMDVPRAAVLSRQAQAYLALEEASGAFNDRGDLLGVAAFNLALACEFDGEVHVVIPLLQEAIRLNEGNPHLWPMAVSHLAQVQMIQGDLHSAEESCRQVLRTYEKWEKPSPTLGIAYTGLGNILVERNELDAAGEYLVKGSELGRSWTLWEPLLAGCFGLSRLKAARGEFEEASRLLQELSGFADRFQVDFAAPAILAQQALLNVRMGDLETAARWAQSTSPPPVGEEIPYYQEGEALLLARVLVALDQAEMAKSLTSRLLAKAEAGQRWGRVIEILALHALALSACGEIEPALDSLRRSLALAEPAGYARVFLDEGWPMADLLGQVCRLKVEGSTQDYACRLLKGFERRSGQVIDLKPNRLPPVNLQPSTRLELLSERELEVLDLIALGLTNQEIAVEMVISLNTVKTHVKNILSRLEVSNRTQAVARARELRIL